MAEVEDEGTGNYSIISQVAYELRCSSFTNWRQRQAIFHRKREGQRIICRRFWCSQILLYKGIDAMNSLLTPKLNYDPTVGGLPESNEDGTIVSPPAISTESVK